MEVPPLSAMRALWVREWAIMHAECAGVSGPGYYVPGPEADVLGRLRDSTAVPSILRATCRCPTRGVS